MVPKKTTGDGGATSRDGPTPKDTYIPIFNTSPGDYKEWRSRINLYRKKPKEAVINLLTSLSGVSWKQVEHNVETYIEDKDGFDKVLAVLDQAFKYDDRVEMPRALEKFFYTMGRRSDQTLIRADGLLRGSPRRSSTVGEAWHQNPGQCGGMAVVQMVWPDLGAEAAHPIEGAEPCCRQDRGEHVLPAGPGLQGSLW